MPSVVFNDFDCADGKGITRTYMQMALTPYLTRLRFVLDPWGPHESISVGCGDRREAGRARVDRERVRELVRALTEQL